MAISSAISNCPLVQQVPVDVGNITTVTTLSVSLSVTGSIPGGCYITNWPALETGLVKSDIGCATAGTVLVRLYNSTGLDINPASQTVEVRGI